MIPSTCQHCIYTITCIDQKSLSVVMLATPQHVTSYSQIAIGYKMETQIKPLHNLKKAV